MTVNNVYLKNEKAVVIEVNATPPQYMSHLLVGCLLAIKIIAGTVVTEDNARDDELRVGDNCVFIIPKLEIRE